MRLAMTAPVVERSTKRRTRLPWITPMRHAVATASTMSGVDRLAHHGLDLVGHGAQQPRRARRRGARRARLAPRVEHGRPWPASTSRPCWKLHLAEPDEADIHVRLSLAIALCAFNLAREFRSACAIPRTTPPSMRSSPAESSSACGAVICQVIAAAFHLGIAPAASRWARSADWRNTSAGALRRNRCSCREAARHYRETKRLLERPDRLRPPAAQRPRSRRHRCVGRHVRQRQTPPSPSVRADFAHAHAGVAPVQVGRLWP